jgi:hypothetical protein
MYCTCVPDVSEHHRRSSIQPSDQYINHEDPGAASRNQSRAGIAILLFSGVDFTSVQRSRLNGARAPRSAAV